MGYAAIPEQKLGHYKAPVGKRQVGWKVETVCEDRYFVIWRIFQKVNRMNLSYGVWDILCLKGSLWVATSTEHLKRIMWLTRPEDSVLGLKEDGLRCHNAPNEVAFSSLFAICLMVEWGLRTTPIYSSEPQREITHPTVSRHQPSKPGLRS